MIYGHFFIENLMLYQYKNILFSIRLFLMISVFKFSKTAWLKGQSRFLFNISQNVILNLYLIFVILKEHNETRVCLGVRARKVRQYRFVTLLARPAQVAVRPWWHFYTWVKNNCSLRLTELRLSLNNALMP